MYTDGEKFYDVIKEINGYQLLQREDGKRTVIRISYENRQVYSAMPGDMPRDGGTWCAGTSLAGVDYVAGFYSRSYANKMFKRLVEAL